MDRTDTAQFILSSLNPLEHQTPKFKAKKDWLASISFYITLCPTILLKLLRCGTINKNLFSKFFVSLRISEKWLHSQSSLWNFQSTSSSLPLPHALSYDVLLCGLSSIKSSWIYSLGGNFTPDPYVTILCCRHFAASVLDDTRVFICILRLCSRTTVETKSRQHEVDFFCTKKIVENRNRHYNYKNQNNKFYKFIRIWMSNIYSEKSEQKSFFCLIVSLWSCLYIFMCRWTLFVRISAV